MVERRECEFKKISQGSRWEKKEEVHQEIRSTLWGSVDVPERHGSARELAQDPFCSLATTVQTQCHGSKSNLAKYNARLINHQKVQIWQIVLEN